MLSSRPFLSDTDVSEQSRGGMLATAASSTVAFLPPGLFMRQDVLHSLEAELLKVSGRSESLELQKAWLEGSQVPYLEYDMFLSLFLHRE